MVFDSPCIYLTSLTLCWLNLNVPMFGVVHPMSCLAKIHLNDVRITDEALPCAAWSSSPPISASSSSLIVVECNNVRGVVVMPNSPLHNFHFMGSPLSPFNLSGGARLLTNLLFCFYTPILGTIYLLSNVTSLSICSNTLQRAGANLDLAILDNFQSLTVLELTMLEFKAVDLDNIFVFLKSCHRPNLKKFLVTVDTSKPTLNCILIFQRSVCHLVTSESVSAFFAIFFLFVRIF
uniref:FBD domain-containing protein n=1 Tax=Oryza meridionalis TaxID=40149 RepID=A0A0E0BZT0_9ORYZ